MGRKKNHARKYYNLRKRKKLRWRKRKLKRMIYLPSYFRYSPNNFYMGTGGGEEEEEDETKYARKMKDVIKMNEFS